MLDRPPSRHRKLRIAMRDGVFRMPDKLAERLAPPDFTVRQPDSCSVVLQLEGQSAALRLDARLQEQWDETAMCVLMRSTFFALHASSLCVPF